MYIVYSIYLVHIKHNMYTVQMDRLQLPYLQLLMRQNVHQIVVQFNYLLDQ